MSFRCHPDNKIKLIKLADKQGVTSSEMLNLLIKNKRL